MKSGEIAFTTTLILHTRENKVIWSPGPTPDVIVTEDRGRLVSFQPEPRYLSVIYAGKDKHSRFYVNKALCDQLIAYINHQSKTLINNQEEAEDELLRMATEDMIADLTAPSAPVTIVPVEIPVAEKLVPVVIPKVEPIIIPEAIEELKPITNKNDFTNIEALTIDFNVTVASSMNYVPGSACINGTKSNFYLTSPPESRQKYWSQTVIAHIRTLIDKIRNKEYEKTGEFEWIPVFSTNKSLNTFCGFQHFSGRTSKNADTTDVFLLKDRQGSAFFTVVTTMVENKSRINYGASMYANMFEADEIFSDIIEGYKSCHPTEFVKLYESLKANGKLKQPVLTEPGLIIDESDLIPERLAELVYEGMKPVDTDYMPNCVISNNGSKIKLTPIPDGTEIKLKNLLNKQLKQNIEQTTSGDLQWNLMTTDDGSNRFLGLHHYEKSTWSLGMCNSGEVNSFVMKDKKGHLFYKNVDSALSYGERKTFSRNIYGNDVKQLLIAFVARLSDTSKRELLTIIKSIDVSKIIQPKNEVKEDAPVPFLDVLTEAIKKEDMQVTIEKLPVNTGEMNKRLEVKYGDGRFLEFTYVDNTELRCHLCTGGKNKRIFINRFKDVAAMVAIVSAMHV